MKRGRLNLVVDLASAAVMLVLALTGLVLFAVLPTGSGGRNGGDGLSLWGWTAIGSGCRRALTCTNASDGSSAGTVSI